MPTVLWFLAILQILPQPSTLALVIPMVQSLLHHSLSLSYHSLLGFQPQPSVPTVKLHVGGVFRQQAVALTFLVTLSCEALMLFTTLIIMKSVWQLQISIPPSPTS